jgi:hypothetical protein
MEQMERKGISYHDSVQSDLFLEQHPYHPLNPLTTKEPPGWGGSAVCLVSALTLLAHDLDRCHPNRKQALNQNRNNDDKAKDETSKQGHGRN